MNHIFFNLIKNIYKISKLPHKRYTWTIEMKVLELDCELSDFIKNYNKKTKFESKLKNNNIYNNGELFSDNSSRSDYIISKKS